MRFAFIDVEKTSYPMRIPAPQLSPKETREILGVELTSCLLPDVMCVERGFEFSDRVPAAFGMGIVRREEEEFVSALFDQPTNGLEGEGREAYLPANIIGRCELQLLDHRLVAAECLRGMIEVAKHSGHPTRTEFDDATVQIRVAFEHAIQRETGKESFR